MEKRCPEDQSVLAYIGGHWQCPTCSKGYRVAGRCLDCGADMERLQACGASNWFCPRCNELKSRSRVETSLARVDA